MNRRTTTEAKARAPVRRHAAVPGIRHPRSVPVPDEEPAAERDVLHPLEEGARDAIDPELRHRLISEAAYALYRERGYVDGYDVEDWLAAEAEVDRAGVPAE